MDSRNIESFLGIDTNDAQELWQLLADTMVSDLEKICRGIGDNDVKSIAFAVHSIKGGAGNLGFGKFSELASMMEVRTKAGRLDDLGDLLLEMQTLLEVPQVSLAGR